MQDIPNFRDDTIDNPYLLVDNHKQYQLMIASLKASTSALALDTERMDGKYFHNRVCLLQIYTPETGAFLVDTLALTELTELQDIFASRDWILHSASNDLPFLAELGFFAPRIFDTQIAAELCGYEKVGLGFLIEQITGIHISKKHQKERWARRPIPQSWLDYAANDVLYLHQLKKVLTRQMQELGRESWAQESCTFICKNYATAPVEKTWLEIRGEATIKNPKNRAVLKSLYQTLAKIAEKRNIPTHFLLQDKDLVNLAKTLPKSPKDSIYQQIKTPKMSVVWQRAINRALKQPVKSWPKPAIPKSLEEISAISRWREKDPYRAELLSTIRRVVNEVSEDLSIKPEILLLAQQQRKIAAHWQPGSNLVDLMQEIKAFSWQVELFSEKLSQYLHEAHKNYRPCKNYRP